ncbi:hypothetical protein CRUP_034138, partial [Coryphaenoides rupestris]
MEVRLGGDHRSQTPPPLQTEGLTATAAAAASPGGPTDEQQTTTLEPDDPDDPDGPLADDLERGLRGAEAGAPSHYFVVHADSSPEGGATHRSADAVVVVTSPPPPPLPQSPVVRPKERHTDPRRKQPEPQDAEVTGVAGVTEDRAARR